MPSFPSFDSVAAPSKARVMVIETDQGQRDRLQTVLRDEGFQVEVYADQTRAKLAAVDFCPQVIVVNQSPFLDENVDQWRGQNWPLRPTILALTAPSLTARLDGQMNENWIDDFLTLPFSDQELVARVRSALRRITREAVPSEPRLRCHDLEMDLVGISVFRAGQKVSLTLTEFKLLRELMLHRGQVQSRERLVEVALSRNQVANRAVDVHVTSLRSKIGPTGEWIETVRGVGYRLKL